MRERRSISVTREGWYYLFILAFIVGGAVMRQINPLFALSGLMIAPLLFNWRSAMAQLRFLRGERRLPARAAVGESLVIDVIGDGTQAGLDAWQVRVLDRMAWVGERRTRGDAVESILPHIPAGGSCRTSYRCYLNRRGQYRFGPLRLETGFPFGLLVASRTFRSEETLIATPRLGRLGQEWKRMVRADRIGSRGASQRRGGTEGDFFALRTYRSGDPIKSIHWRSSARLGQLMVRQNEQRTDRQVALLLELWIPENCSNEDLDAVETAVSFAATALVDLCGQSVGRLTLSVAAEESFFHAGSPSPALRNTVLDFLALAKATSTVDGLAAWLEAGAGGGGGASLGATLLITTRPPESEVNLVVGVERPDWTTRIPRISVRDPVFRKWFQLMEEHERGEERTSVEAAMGS